ncbi:MAG: T9SS type A sorting domain-containing protein [Ignavibacteria bacterium]|jgi:parallel beta-helix repeat protein|nr:T9SS type A sorting domain-containing protein [Ignavibacteria bacterium]
MKKRNYILILPLILVVSFLIAGFSIEDSRLSKVQGITTDVTQPPPNIYPFSVEVFVDSMNGANDTTALKSRGYLVYYRGTGPQGAAATWFQGNETVFPAFNGPPTGYVAANYQVVTGMNDIDSWLVLPALNIGSGDTLSFYERSVEGSAWVDSMRVMYNPTGATLPEDMNWIELGRFQNNIAGTIWIEHRFTAPTPSVNGRFALRYAVVDGGPSGLNSNYIGVDYIRVLQYIPPTLSGDYSIGTVLFNALTGKNITFRKKTRLVTEQVNLSDYYLNPEKYEKGNIVKKTVEMNGELRTVEEIQLPTPQNDAIVNITYEQEYYEPLSNGQPYEGSLYHKFTESERIMYGLGDGVGVYATITAAVADANTMGVSGPTRFLLLDATYPSETFPIIFDNVPGTSAVNTLTLLPAAGVTTLISGSPSNNHIFRVQNSDYIIFDGRQNGTTNPGSMTIENLNTTGTLSHTIRLIDGSSNNAIQYCILNNGTAGSAGPRTIEISTSVSDPGGNSNNLIANNTINGGRSGIGFSGTSANPNLNNVVENNVIQNFGYAGIWLISNSSSNTIRGNTITNAGSSINTLCFGLNIGAVGGDNVYYNNEIIDITSASTSTIRGIQISPGAGSTHTLYNNMVALTQDNGTKTSIYAISAIGSSQSTFNIYYNTTNISGTHTGGTAGVIVSCGYVTTTSNVGTTVNYKNNINKNTRTGGTAGVFHGGGFISNLNPIYNVDYNSYWATGDPGSFNAGWGTTVYTVLADYKAAVTPNEQNSIFKDVSFVSGTNLRLIAPSIGDIDLAGTPIAGITTDIDGDLRDAGFPYKGADEGNIPLPVDLASFNASVDGRNVTLSWETTWEINNDKFEIQRRNNVQDAEWTTVGTVQGAGTSYQPHSYSFTDKNLVTGKYEYRLVQFDFDGNSTADFTLNHVVEIGTPSVFGLSQNYPNPFNPSTKINFEIPVEGLVKLLVYDLSGREVASLVNEVLTPGYYTAEFNGANLSSGIYFYRLVTNNNTITKKMILIK